MSGNLSKTSEIENRERKGELAEGLFVCPFLGCKVKQKFRSLKGHCAKKHGSKIALMCFLGDSCEWSCGKSIRCLTSHRNNLEVHEKIPFHGGINLDNTCEIIPVEEPSDELADGHTAECAAARIALVRFTAKRKKKEVRAALKEKRMDGKKK